MDILLADTRLVLRGLVRRPGLTLVVVVTLALGTGANAAIFSAVDGLLLRQPPFRAPHELVRITTARGDESGGMLSTPERDDLRALPQIAAAAMYTDLGMYNASGFGTPEELQATITTHDLFEVLGRSGPPFRRRWIARAASARRAARVDPAVVLRGVGARVVRTVALRQE